MHRDILFKVIVLAALLIAVAINIYKRGMPDDRDGLIFSRSELQTLVPEGDMFKKKESPFLYYEIYKKKELTGYCFNTRDIVPDEKGYYGHIEMLVALDRFGRIQNLRVLRHNETSQYVSGIEKPRFLDQFKNKGIEDRFVIGEDIDGITQATISSRAVAKILKVSIDKMQEHISYTYPLPVGERVGVRGIELNIDFYITILIITFLLVVFYLKIQWLRYIGLSFTILYFGFIKANFISMANLGSIFLGNLPDLESNITWYIFIFSGLILTFLLGTFYCSYMCPFGALQIFLKKAFKFNIEITSALAGRLRKIRFFLLWLLSILILVFNNPNVANYEPFSTVFLRRGTVINWAIALIILGLSLFHYRPFCNYFCGAGAFLDILSGWGRRILKRR